VRTGCGKSPVSRVVAAAVRAQGLTPVVIRHPMPYGDLARQAVQRFAVFDDLLRHRCTIEEREEYEPHLAANTVVYAGMDYEAILRRAEEEADVILWDGGNNDTPFYRPDLEIVVADPHRPGHEMSYFPGEVNFRRAQVIVINKVNTAPPEGVARVRQNIAAVNPSATVIEAACDVTVDDPALIRGRRVLVVEDGPTLTHGEMPYGAGVVAAREAWAGERVDPRPYAVGSIASTFARYPHVDGLLPAMGYSDVQCRELEETINRTPCDVVLAATPIDLGRLLKLVKPCVRARYEIGAKDRPRLADLVADFCARRARKPAPVA
jgi:predicted GTPase